MMLAATVRKDLLLLVRDRGALISLFLLPVVFIAVFGAIFGGSGTPDPAKLSVWHAPGDDRGAAIVTALEQTGSFEVTRAPDEARAREDARDDDVVGLILPPDLDPRAGRPAELLIDPATPPPVRAPIEGIVRAVVTRVVLGPQPADSLEIVRAVAPAAGTGRGPAITSGFQITVPGNAVLFGFFIALTCAISFVEERRTGTWLRLLAAPVNRRLLLLLKLVPYVLVGLNQLTFLFGTGIAIFGMEVAGSPLALGVLSVALVLCATSLGFAMASLGGTEKQLGAMGSTTLLVMGLLGGCMVPRFVMPALMRKAGLLVPHGWALDGYFDVLVRPGTTLVDIAPQIAALLGFAALFATVGSLLFRFER